MRILLVPVSSRAVAAAAWLRDAEPGQRRSVGACPGGVRGARVALGLTVRRPLDLGPALRTVEGEGGAARPCRCVRGEDAQSSSVR